jgi:hypothetical protein
MLLLRSASNVSHHHQGKVDASAICEGNNHAMTMAMTTNATATAAMATVTTVCIQPLLIQTLALYLSYADIE